MRKGWVQRAALASAPLMARLSAAIAAAVAEVPCAAIAADEFRHDGCQHFGSYCAIVPVIAAFWGLTPAKVVGMCSHMHIFRRSISLLQAAADLYCFSESQVFIVPPPLQV